jgi:hypothetical protein
MLNGRAPVGGQTVLRDIHSLWIGDRLGPLEELCLSSFIQQGHRFFLHTYKTFDVPAGVTLLDANDLVPENQIIRFRRTGSVSLFADRYRYEILRKFDVYWADVDIFCLRPFEFSGPYLFGVDRVAEGRNILNNAVLGAPADSEFLARLLALFAKPSLALRFLTPAERMKLYWNAVRRFQVPGLEDFPWGSAGPIAVTHIAEELGIIDLAQPLSALFELKGLKLFTANSNWEQAINDGAYCAHFVHSKFARRPVDLLAPVPGSFYEFCVKQAGGMTSTFKHAVSPRAFAAAG